MNTKLDQYLLFIPLYVIALWVIVGFVISRMGWHQFAKKYASVTRPLGRSFHCQIVWFGSIFASYRNAVRIVISDAGIYFYPIILFRAFHPPFLVPWDKVVGVIKRKRFFIVSQDLKIRDDAGEIHIGMSESAVLELQRLAFHGKRKNLTVKCGAKRRTLPP